MNSSTSTLREDILFELTGDSYGEELYVDTKAKYIADDMLGLIETEKQRLLAECTTELLKFTARHDQPMRDSAIKIINKVLGGKV